MENKAVKNSYMLKFLINVKTRVNCWKIFLPILIVFDLKWSIVKCNKTISHHKIFYWNPPGNNIGCHHLKSNNLPKAQGTFTPRNNSIFFHETSCRGGMDSRQTCSVESAARLHPNREIYVLFSAPIEDYVLKHSALSILTTYPNVKLYRVNITEYSRNTPLETMVSNNVISKSKWHIEHTSDLLRYLTLYKWAGIYLDTDTIVVKSFDYLGGNWIGKQDHELVNSAIIGISNDDLGRRVIEDVVRELNDSYDPYKWAHNGPGSLRRVLQRMCKSDNITEWTAYNCEGFPVYGTEYFYPVPYEKYQYYFRTGELMNFTTAYTHHFWNKLSSNTSIPKGSPYQKLAQKYCPKIFGMYGDLFGN